MLRPSVHLRAMPVGLLAAALVLSLSACGGGAIATRPGDAWQCGKQLRKVPKSDPLLGWLSISSLDRWIAAVDRIGQRAGQFAPGSSVRTTALAMAEERAAAAGIKHLRWLDMTRPIHAMVQADPRNPIFGVSLVVPAKDRGDAEAATARLRSEFKAKGHDLVLDMSKANPEGTGGRKPMWVDWLNPKTALATLDPARFERAQPLAQCVATRQPRELLHVGVAVADLLARHRDSFESGRKLLWKLGRQSGQDQRMLAYWSKRAEQLMTDTDAGVLLVSAGQEDVRLGVELFAKPGSDLDKGWSRQAKLGANPLAALLPPNAWLAVTQSYDPTATPRELKLLLDFYMATMKVPETEGPSFREEVKTLLGLLGPHSAFAMYRDGRFPLAMYGAAQAKQPERAVDLMAKIALRGVRFALRQAMAKGAALSPSRRAGGGAANGATGAPPAPASKHAGLKQLHDLLGRGWGAAVDELVRKSQRWPVHFSRHHSVSGGRTCRALRMTPDVLALTKIPAQMRMVTAFLPKRLDLQLCTEGETIHLALAPHATTRIAEAAGGRAPSLTKQPWFQAASQLAGKPAHMVFALNPRPVVEIAQAFESRLPEWPKGTSISTVCGYGAQQLRCDLRLPVVIADFVAALRSAP